MSAALMPLGQALRQGVLLSPIQQSYYNAYSLGRWPWLVKTDRAGRQSRQLWVDLAGFRDWCWDTGRQLGTEQAAKLDAAIREAAKQS